MTHTPRGPIVYDRDPHQITNWGPTLTERPGIHAVCRPPASTQLLDNLLEASCVRQPSAEAPHLQCCCERVTGLPTLSG
jgi:hypothetical protein